YVGAALVVGMGINIVVRISLSLRADPYPPAPSPVAGEGEKNRKTGHAASKAGRMTRFSERIGIRARLEALGPVRAMTYVAFLAMLGLVLVYALFAERYFLPLLPAAIVLLLDLMRGLRPAWWLAGAGLLAMSLFSVGLMWDYYDWHAARWANSQALIAQGVPLEKLDAGYGGDGWVPAVE